MDVIVAEKYQNHDKAFISIVLSFKLKSIQLGTRMDRNLFIDKRR
ncbi:hypothetical protein HMPREF3038_00525 [Akkermansia sp. KLE1797]|nr:hypothetical protein HMPREF3038_00525 [Akkermansia sp. KLE1797]KXU55360.1 hypothetical protein HMPREF3039_00466 [Akkermansia sp. KLE1798]KZA05863.1 hypothetical protein HMPREF1326_00443 [Akkermansia sp. KLE1605]